MTSRGRAKAAGLSLLEVLVAMAIMAMSLTLLYRVEAGAVRAVGDYAWQQRVGVLARSLLDSVDSVPAGGLDESGQVAGVAWRLSTSPVPVPAGLDTGTPVLHEVRVLVRSADAGPSRQVEVTTLLPQSLPVAGGEVR